MFSHLTQQAMTASYTYTNYLNYSDGSYLSHISE
jgi:hypothetical protein